MSDASCPKCGFARDPQSVDCPVCGIVFSRYKARPETGSSSLPAAAPVDSPSTFEPAGETFYESPGGAANPYAAPEALVLMPARTVTEQPLARRFTRLAARILDSLIFLVLIAPFALVIALFEGNDAAMAAGIVLIVLAVLGIAGLNLYFLAKDGQTLGKKALKVRIVMTDGAKAGLGRILLMRILAPGILGAIPLVGPVFSIANVLFIFGVEQRCLHDHMAGTKVVVA